MSDNVLPTKQKKAIVALLTEVDQQTAAAVVGVNPKTITRWLQSEPFRAALATAEREAVSDAARSIAAGGREAVEHFRRILADPEAEPKRRDYAADRLAKYLDKFRLLGAIEGQLNELLGNRP